MLLRRGLAEGALLARLVHFLLCWRSSCSVGAALARLVHLRQVHPLSVPPFAFAVRSVSVRRPIVFRPPSNRFPSAVRLDSVRSPIGFRPPSVEKCWEKRCKNVVLNGNTIGDFAIFDVSVFRCFYYPHPNHLCRSEICGRITVCLVGALLALASGKAERRQVHPLKLHLKSVGEYSAVNSVSSAYSVGKNSAVNFVHSVKSAGEYSVINSVSSEYSVGYHSVKPSMKSCFFVQFRRLLEKNAI